MLHNNFTATSFREVILISRGTSRGHNKYLFAHLHRYAHNNESQLHPIHAQQGGGKRGKVSPGEIKM